MSKFQLFSLHRATGAAPACQYLSHTGTICVSGHAAEPALSAMQETFLVLCRHELRCVVMHRNDRERTPVAVLWLCSKFGWEAGHLRLLQAGSPRPAFPAH